MVLFFFCVDIHHTDRDRISRLKKKKKRKEKSKGDGRRKIVAHKELYWRQRRQKLLLLLLLLVDRSSYRIDLNTNNMVHAAGHSA